jgi:hypothetical protein
MFSLPYLSQTSLDGGTNATSTEASLTPQSTYGCGSQKSSKSFAD